MPLQRQSRAAGLISRAFQTGVDALLACLTLFVVLTFFGWLIPVVPGLDDGKGFAFALCSGEGPCDMSWVTQLDGTSGITFWISVALALLTFVLTSGALSQSRKSMGMSAASTLPIPRRNLGTSDITPPGRLTMALRWTIVLVVFMVGAVVGGGMVGVLLVALCWLPSLFGPRLAVYDLLTGVAIAEVSLVERDVAVAPQP
jgi:hypothetical protein